MGKMIQKGDIYDYPNTSDSTIAAGTLKLIGKFVGVVQNDIPAGEVGSVALSGVWKIPKNTGVTFGIGDPVYLTNNAAGASGYFVGYAWAAVASSAKEMLVKLAPGLQKSS